MFSLIGIFITLVTLAAARPGVLQSQVSLETIGSFVNHIPTSISHQSKTEIHDQQSVISSILGQVPVLQQSPIISSQIQSSSSALLADQGQILSDDGQEAVIGGGDTLLNDQNAILQNQDSLIGGQSIIAGDYGQSSIIGNSGLLANTINFSDSQLNGIEGLRR